MKACPWEKITGFESYAEFERFHAWMRETIAEGKAEKIPVLERYQGITSFTEEWYRHVASQSTWRLVWPDPPFTGLFERVKA